MPLKEYDWFAKNESPPATSSTCRTASTGYILRGVEQTIGEK